jgi:hypothetical protein
VNFISQTIVFALALMGTLFKSTRTDEHGKTTYTASGLPMLTTTGKVVVTLLSISFCVSLITIWQKNKSEEDARNARIQAEQYTKGIDDTVRRVLAVSSQLSEEQKRKFQDVLERQETSGKKIAGEIGASTDLFRERIESSSKLINGRIGTSIDLLNHSASALGALGDPITSIGADLEAEIPLEDPSLVRYRSQLETASRGYLASTSDSNPFGLEWIDSSTVKIPVSSSLFPDLMAEPIAARAMRLVTFIVEFHKKPLLEQELAVPRTKDFVDDPFLPGFDLGFYLEQTVGNAPDPKEYRAFYNIESHRLSIELVESFGRPSQAPVDLPSLNNWIIEKGTARLWTRSVGNNIVGISDLAGSQIVVRMLWTRWPSEDATRVFKDVRIHFLTFFISNELTLYCVDPRSIAEAKDIRNLPREAVGLKMQRHRDSSGLPFYVCQIPPAR